MYLPLHGVPEYDDRQIRDRGGINFTLPSLYQPPGCKAQKICTENNKKRGLLPIDSRNPPKGYVVINRKALMDFSAPYSTLFEAEKDTARPDNSYFIDINNGNPG